MSSRQLRKLQKQRELEEAKNQSIQAPEESDEDEDPTPSAAKPKMSLFAALGAGQDENEQGDDDQEEDHGMEQAAGQEDTQSVQPSKRSRKKKKSKNKAKATGTEPEDAVEDQDQGGEDEIDKAIKELKISGQKRQESSDPKTPHDTARRINELLSINTSHLKAINEMRNLFGRDVIESANAEEEQQNNRRGRGRQQRQVDLETFLRGPPGAKKLPEVALRRNVFIQGREHWPRDTAGGLAMKQLGKAEDGSYTEYAYFHEGEYDAVQATFFTFTQMGEPMNLVRLLQERPYHVSTLLQVSSVAKQDQNMALAAELCERALFTFGRVATSSFRQDLEQGRARLDFRRPENRQLWLAGYHYLRSLIRKGTYRTALEWAKLLFALDHKDPYAMRHFLHFLALRTYESRWLIDFMDELGKMGDNGDTVYLRQSVVLAKLQMNDVDGARAELQSGMQRVPWLYCALYQELGLDAPPSIWGISAESDARSFWVKLYIYQTKDLWNNTAATSLLQQVAKELGRVDTSCLPADDAPPDLGSTRLVYLEGQTSLLAVAPRELLDTQPNYESDPLPPPKEENIFTGSGCQAPWDEGSAGAFEMQRRLQGQVLEMLERERAAGGRHGAARAGLGEDGEEGENAELDAIDMDDPELRRDLEEHARRADEPGVVQRFLQMFRGETAPGDETIGDDEREGAGRPEDSVEGPLPGAWPEDEGHGRDEGR